MGNYGSKDLIVLDFANPGYFNHVVTIQPGKGHGINYYNVTPWLIQQKREILILISLSFYVL